MFNLTRKGLWAHKVRFLLTGLAVVLGVAFMAGTMILTDTMGQTFDGLFATSNKGIDVVVQRTTDIDSDVADVHERVDATTLEQIRKIDGVDAAAGSIEGVAQIVGSDGKVMANDGLSGTAGVAWIADERLNPFSLRSGHAPHGPSEMVIDQASLEHQGWKLGDTVGVLAKSSTTQMTIVGTAGFGDADGIPGYTVVAADAATAQAMFAQPGAYDSIVVAAADGTSPGALSKRVEAAVGSSQLEVLTGKADTADKQADFKKSMSFFNTFLMAFAYISLFVGMFIIYNTFSIIIAQRMREMALLRAIGASRRQVLRSVLLESALVGAISSAAGLGAGVLMSYGLRALLAGVGLDLPSGSVVISSGTVTTAFVVGITVTMLSSVGPALRASRIKPIAALRETAIESTSTSIKRTVLGLAVLGAGITAFAAGIAGDGSGAMKVLGLGVLGVIFGVFVLGPVIARPAMHLLGFPTKLSGTTGRLARENAKRNPRRSAATASALMIGVALVAFITILASTTKASTEHAVDTSLRADYVVDSGQWGSGGFGPSIEQQLADLPQVDLVSPLRTVPVQIDGGTTEISAFDTSVIEELVDFGVTAGSVKDIRGNAIGLSADRAKVLGVGVGDTVTAHFSATGDVALTVKAIFDGDLLAAGDMSNVIDTHTFEANVTDVFDQQVYVTTNGDAAASRVAIDKVLEQWPNATLEDQAAFKQSITKEIGTMLNLIYGLLALAIIIALIGIANTLALSVHERTRELGLLRAVGMTRRQLRTAIRWESVLISLLGTALGFFLGVGGAWGITKASDSGITTFVVPGTQLAVIVGLAIFAGVLAALGPARRAAKLNVLDAIATA
jgi:putative ABC transport system permease protein